MARIDNMTKTIQMIRGKQSLRFLPLLMLAAFLCGCAGLSPATDPAAEKKATAMVEAVRAFNRDISTGKGTGWLTLETLGQRQRFKIAWAAGTPNRLRLTMILSGLLFETIAASGEQVTFVSHTGRHDLHTTVSADPDLDTYIDVPIRLSELIAVLLGQVPVRPYDRAWISQDDPSTVVTSRYFYEPRQKITTDATGRISRYRLTDTGGDLIYSITYTAFKRTHGIDLPADLTLTDGNGRTLRLTLTTMVPNAQVKESVFRLTASGS
ncbi:MAG TPA: hypothetical protein DHV36_08235 [Desulfobacteraceae bacterium]|nr:hypothetical protein [Desulfobacteraceae bacterium]